MRSPRVPRNILRKSIVVTSAHKSPSQTLISKSRGVDYGRRNPKICSESRTSDLRRQFAARNRQGDVKLLNLSNIAKDILPNLSPLSKLPTQTSFCSLPPFAKVREFDTSSATF